MSQSMSNIKRNGFISIFDWINRARRPFWIIFFVIISLVAHVVCFYLFSVVYPEQKRSTLKPMEITILDLDNPKSKSIMNQIDDRLIILDQDVNSVIAVNEPLKSGVEFKPFFKDYMPEYMEFSKKVPSAEQDLIDFSQFYLPPVNGSNLIGRNIQLAKKSSPEILFNWEADSRKVIKGFQWSDEDGGIGADSGTEFLVQIGVNRFGIVTHIFPEISFSENFEKKVIKALKDMRFSQITAETISWANVEISW